MSHSSTYSSFLPVDSDDNKKATILKLDPLGFTYEAKQLEKQTLALTDPKKYIGERNAAIKKLQGEVYTAYIADLKRYAEDEENIPESIARKKADSKANATWAAGMVGVNEDYPLTALGIATERQHSANATEFNDGVSMKRTLTKRAPKKAPKRAPKRK